jgi:hypothetical protein
MENWRIIHEAPNYEVSDLGRIRNSIKGNILKGTINNEGYLWVTLRNNGINVPRAIHRLVAYYFVTNPYNLSDVNHVKGIKTNNRASQLEWCSRAQNNEHAIRTGLRKLYRGGKVNACKKVKCKLTGVIFTSVKEAAEKRKLNYNSLRAMMCGVSKNTTSLTYV